MELVGNVERRRYIRQAATTTPVAVTPRNRPYRVGPPTVVGKWNSPKVLEKNVSVGCRHWMVGSPFKRFVRYDDSTVNRGIGSGHISLGSPRSAVQDRQLLPTDRSTCLRAVYDRSLLPAREKSLAATSMVGYRPIVVGVVCCILLYIIALVARYYLSSSLLVVWCEPWGVELKNHSNASTSIRNASEVMVGSTH